MPSKRAKAAKPVPTPQAFFDGAVPRVLTIMRATCAELGGKHCIVVEGAGEWTLDFPNARVVAGRHQPDVTVYLAPEQFASLSTSKVELAKLVADGKARYEGDRSRVENVSLILAFLER